MGDNILDIDIDFEDLALDSAHLERQEPRKVQSSYQPNLGKKSQASGSARLIKTSSSSFNQATASSLSNKTTFSQRSNRTHKNYNYQPKSNQQIKSDASGPNNSGSVSFTKPKAAGSSSSSNKDKSGMRSDVPAKPKKLNDIFGSMVKAPGDKSFHSKSKTRKATSKDVKLNNQNTASEDILVVRKRIRPAETGTKSPEPRETEIASKKPASTSLDLRKTLQPSGSARSVKSSFSSFGCCSASPLSDKTTFSSTESKPKGSQFLRKSSSSPSTMKPEPTKLKYSGYSFGQLNHLANLVRQDILDMLYHAGSGHSAGSLDQVEIFVALYFRIMRHDPKDPLWAERDILVQSNGHTAPVRYAVMARAGYFPRQDLLSLRRFNSDLQGHPERERIPALETTSGPLGSGLSQASGMALSLMMDGNKTRRIYCTMGDGELNEGNVWEAAMFAAKYRLGNLVGIVDRNNIQIDGYAEDVMPLENLREKWESFGWYVQEVDGNNIESVISALSLARSQTAKPNLIIAHTTPGKGVDFMEYDPAWHGKSPNKAQEQDAIRKLRTLDGKIEGGHL